MKICIVTVYDSLNSGSYWQAFALGSVLKKRGHEVCYCQRAKKGASSSRVTQLRHIGKLALTGHFTELRDYTQIIKQFKKQIAGFDVIDRGDPAFKDAECVILGSDTIWNLDVEYFRENKAIYWGDAFDCRVFSYAGSVANTKAERFQPVKDFADSVSRWTGISVRDEYTKSILSGFTDREITRVCDPTMLLEADDYRTVCKDKEGGYIFAYLFDPLNKAQNDALRAFADAKGLKIIVGTFRNVVDGADAFIINSPARFMEHMLGAAYVVTDTYHGTIFSTNFRKQYAVIDRNKNKVNEFLSDVGLEDRLIGKDCRLEEILDRAADYSKADAKIRDIKRSSIAFIEKNLTKEETVC